MRFVVRVISFLFWTVVAGEIQPKQAPRLLSTSHKAKSQVPGAKKYVYGKYKAEHGDTMDNSLYIFYPKDLWLQTDGKVPVVIQFHGGGFITGAPFKSMSAEIEPYLNKGFAFISVGYRLTTRRYYYSEKTKINNLDVRITRVEELIHIDEAGRLSLDKSGLTMAHLKVRIGRAETITKGIYDAVEALEYLITNSDHLLLDVHRICFVARSEGGSLASYLTWVYHSMNSLRYTPRALIQSSAQLDYPVNNALDKVWSLYADGAGRQAKVSSYVAQPECGGFIGNLMCEIPVDPRGEAGPDRKCSEDTVRKGTCSEYFLCNRSWHRHTMDKFCKQRFSSVTIGELLDEQVWPRKEHLKSGPAAGFEVLWYTSRNMVAHKPSPNFYLYIANSLKHGFSHSPIYARMYQQYADKGGVDYAIYYDDYPNMKSNDRVMPQIRGLSEDRLGNVADTDYNYLSSFDWRKKHHSIVAAKAGSLEERALFACYAVGCDISIAPAAFKVALETPNMDNLMHGTPKRPGELDGTDGPGALSSLGGSSGTTSQGSSETSSADKSKSKENAVHSVSVNGIGHSAMPSAMVASGVAFFFCCGVALFIILGASFFVPAILLC